MRQAGHVARMRNRRGAYRVVVRPLGRIRHRWEYNVKTGLKEMASGVGGGAWTGLELIWLRIWTSGALF
jgi:hypothetical protein